MSFNIKEIMQKAKQMQNQMQAAQQELSNIEVHGEAGARGAFDRLARPV